MLSPLFISIYLKLVNGDFIKMMLNKFFQNKIQIYNRNADNKTVEPV